MKKGVAIAGGVTLLVSGISLILGFVTLMGYEPNEENTLHDTRVDGMMFNYSGGFGLLDVFVVGDVFCFDYLYENDLQILNSSGENVFYGNCDTEYASTEYTYVGSIDAMQAEEFTIVSEGDLIIIDGESILGSRMLWDGLWTRRHHSADCWLSNRTKRASSDSLRRT
jgi:hypothetical protein